MTGTLSALELRDRLEQVPRVRLAQLPTPLEEAPRLAAHLGVGRLLIKRDDMTGLGLGGNKVRTLEYTMREAIDLDRDLVVGAAYLHSNHCRQLAAAAAKLGLEALLILRKRADMPATLQGNYLLGALFGARIELVESKDSVTLLALAERRVEELRSSGRRPMLATLSPASKVWGTVAAVRTALEVDDQIRELGIDRVHVYASSGASTYAAVSLASHVAGLPFITRGISHQHTSSQHADQTLRLAAGAAERLGLPPSAATFDVDIDDRFRGVYGLPDPASLEATRLAAMLEGLVLDPVYTAKGLVGLAAHVREGRVGPHDAVVFIHTGGMPAVFTLADRFALDPTASVT